MPKKTSVILRSRPAIRAVSKGGGLKKAPPTARESEREPKRAQESKREPVIVREIEREPEKARGSKREQERARGSQKARESQRKPPALRGPPSLPRPLSECALRRRRSLPLTRRYARYFGGDLNIMSMEGYGTDAFLHLSRLGNKDEPLP